LKAFELNPGSAQVRANLGAAYLIAGRLDDAARVIREAQAENLDVPANHFNQFLIDFLHHDRAAMARDDAGLVGKPGYDYRRIHLESSIAAYAGRLTQARELNRKAVDAALVRDEKENAAGFLADAALAEALAGNFAEARKQAREAVRLADGKVVEGRSAVALALCRAQDQAGRLAEDLNTRFPQDTLVQYGFLPMIRSALALRGGDPKKAVEELVPAVPFEASTYMVLYPAYLRGEALLAAGDGAGAAREFQKTFAYPGVVLDDLSGALARLELGRAFSTSGDLSKAKNAYTDFLALWKDADPDIEIRRQAKAEYTKLESR
jgi:tetratricopeptide (TPR) repeat protein